MCLYFKLPRESANKIAKASISAHSACWMWTAMPFFLPLLQCLCSWPLPHLLQVSPFFRVMQRILSVLRFHCMKETENSFLFLFFFFLIDRFSDQIKWVLSVLWKTWNFTQWQMGSSLWSWLGFAWGWGGVQRVGLWGSTTYLKLNLFWWKSWKNTVL